MLGRSFTGGDGMVRERGAMAVREMRMERSLLALGVKPRTDGKLKLKDECLYGGDRGLDRPHDLTAVVERALQSRECREA
jgi:hypothetical protein